MTNTLTRIAARQLAVGDTIYWDCPRRGRTSGTVTARRPQFTQTTWFDLDGELNCLWSGTIITKTNQLERKPS